MYFLTTHSQCAETHLQTNSCVMMFNLNLVFYFKSLQFKNYTVVLKSQLVNNQVLNKIKIVVRILSRKGRIQA